MLKAFIKQFTKNEELQRLQDNVANALTPVLNSVIISGELLRDIPVSTSDTVISHGLQRKPLGWIVISKNSNSNVWEMSRSDRGLTLRASSATTISLWVF